MIEFISIPLAIAGLWWYRNSVKKIRIVELEESNAQLSAHIKILESQNVYEDSIDVYRNVLRYNKSHLQVLKNKKFLW